MMEKFKVLTIQTSWWRRNDHHLVYGTLTLLGMEGEEGKEILENLATSLNSITYTTQQEATDDLLKAIERLIELRNEHLDQ